MYIGGTNSADLLISGATDDFVYGFGGNDRIADAINFAPSNDTFRGGDGNDELISYHGTDALYGGAGNDKFIIDGRADNVTAWGGKGRDVLTLWREDLMYAEDEQWMLENGGVSFLLQFKDGGVVDINSIEYFVFL